MKKVSIIIPTYKPQQYLKDCLLSLARQTMPYENFEVLLILNGETDKYIYFVEQCILLLPIDFPILFIHTSLIGVSKARNIGLDMAKGEYICFIDDDDYVSSSYIEQLYKIATPNTISASKPIAFYHESNIINNYRITKTYNKLSHKQIISFTRLRGYFSGPCMKMFHKSIIGNRRFNLSFTIGEDVVFMFLISNKFDKVAFTDENAIYYRRVRKNSISMSHRSYWKKVSNALRITKEITQIYINAPHKYNFYFYLTRIIGAIKAIFK